MRGRRAGSGRACSRARSARLPATARAALAAARAPRPGGSANHPPQLRDWLCIHRYEGSWTDSGTPVLGRAPDGLLGFQQTYGGWLLQTRDGGPLERRSSRSGWRYSASAPGLLAVAEHGARLRRVLAHSANMLLTARRAGRVVLRQFDLTMTSSDVIVRPCRSTATSRRSARTSPASRRSATSTTARAAELLSVALEASLGRRLQDALAEAALELQRPARRRARRGPRRRPRPQLVLVREDDGTVRSRPTRRSRPGSPSGSPRA